jgi:alpha-tubulin suppressor-like RCC1 family protein
LGQLGDNTTTTTTVPVPVDVSGVLAGTTITGISAGGNHTCAVADGRAFCWGYNVYGQLGNNSTTDTSVPVAVDTSGVLASNTITAISAGLWHTCAVADGRAYCWGSNASGELGNDSITDSAVPVAVDASGVLAGKTIAGITAGGSHSCAVADGRGYCWGANFAGQLGNNSTAFSAAPVAVDTSGVLADKTVTAISAGYQHTCAVADGRGYCWGWNLESELGNNSTAWSKVPVPVDTSGELAGKTVTAISAGNQHTCALADGRAYCWGDNRSGQLGNNNTTLTARVPVAVDTAGPLAFRTVWAISAGGYHTCAAADGRAACWGHNGSGQLGNNSATDSRAPVPVDTSGLLNTKPVTAIDAGGSHTAALFTTPPQAPTGVVGVPGNGQVSVSWTAPVDDGGSPILEYMATATPGGTTCTTAGTSCTVAGLTNGTPYTFTVTARNAIGTSPASAPSAPVTPAAPAPAKVIGVKAKVHKGTVKITWKKVAGATSYRARISKPGGTKYKAWKTTPKRVFKAKVKKGKKYRFQVRAVGAGGRGPVTTVRFKGK